MTIYKIIKIAILLGICTHSHAIVLEQTQIQSGAGELLYAEIPFKNSDMSSAIRVNLALDADLTATGLAQRIPGSLNFYTRRNADGSGVIVITSTRPIIDSDLNIVIKVVEGNAARIQQIKMPMHKPQNATVQTNSMTEKRLEPIVLVSERDIALNLAESSRHKPETLSPTNKETYNNSPLVMSTGIPPALQSVSTQNLVKTLSSNQTASSSANAFTSNSNAISINPTSQTALAEQNNPVAPLDSKQNTPKQLTKYPSTAHPIAKSQPSNPQKQHSQKHIVKSNESLWSIAQKIAVKSKRNVSDVMREIQSNNQHAFINGNANRLRQGVALNLYATRSSQKPTTRASTATSKSQFQQTGNATKYRLDQAEMTLVTDKQNNTQQLSSQNSNQNKAPAVNNKIKNMRLQTLNLQQSVTQSELALKQKEVRIKLLNEKLAQLQLQLSKQNKTDKTVKKSI
ncbi:type IV pilus assembly protein FimV [Acinetobacter gerneri]|uniref:FimV N-terminal domain-containing protein n=1 Tax=Acinetobacter gerneri DSM 14967 = CIP 107464 = MTCC 9824 TaxID=1120926 RepID=N8ZUW4_9GAMM|nr:hypothetical protein [Acinetobacter gerneri]ENV35290.1 hypothetical protein F960_00588 [Acinetobacter gerneri DSM 14967 = CIP 107464 = MTCC 9824]EPR81255.1 Tfp pilus assembly protein FimV [Acinetobacter gerneri DSM 14967 = CIP 107464 = MTCC 9824]